MAGVPPVGLPPGAVPVAPVHTSTQCWVARHNGVGVAAGPLPDMYALTESSPLRRSLLFMEFAPCSAGVVLCSGPELLGVLLPPCRYSSLAVRARLASVLEHFLTDAKLSEIHLALAELGIFGQQWEDCRLYLDRLGEIISSALPASLTALFIGDADVASVVSFNMAATLAVPGIPAVAAVAAQPARPAVAVVAYVRAMPARVAGVARCQRSV